MQSEEDEPETDESPAAPEEENSSWGDRMLVPDRPLSPRHRKLAELLAQGKKNFEIAKELELTESRVSILKSNTRIRDLAEEIRERAYEEAVGARLKRMAEPALNEIDRCLADKTNRYKENLKVDTARWIIEKIDGKAAQKYDIGENMLGVMMDRLDALKNAGKGLTNAERDVIEVSATPQIEGQIAENPAKPEEDYLKNWVADFTGLPKD